jgi:hypothetical protein
MDKVRVEVREGRGRCLVAERTFARGDIIMSHSPYEAVLYDDQVEARCHYTFALGQNLQRCALFHVLWSYWFLNGSLRFL